MHERGVDRDGPRARRRPRCGLGDARATLRISVAKWRSRLRTPASRVYSCTTRSIASSASCDLLGREAVRLELLRHQVAARDHELVALGVAGQLDHLHAVEQRRRDRREGVRGGDEEHLREVEGHLEVVVAEGRVLLGVEHLEQRRRRVAAEVRAELVDLVEQEHRVARAGAAQALEDAARHRADVGAAVAADLRLVAHAAERGARELAPHRARDRAAERGLADARAGRRSRGSGLRRRARACARRGTRGCGPSPSRGRDGRRRGPSRAAREVELVLGLDATTAGRRSTRGRCGSGGGRARGRAARAAAGARGRPARAPPREASRRRCARAARRPRAASRRPRRSRARCRACGGAGCARAAPGRAPPPRPSRACCCVSAIVTSRSRCGTRRQSRAIGSASCEQRDALVGGQAHVRGDQVGEQARRREVLEALLPLVGDVVAQVDHAVGEVEHPRGARPRARPTTRGRRAAARCARAATAPGRPRRACARAAARPRSPACPRAARRRRARRA